MQKSHYKNEAENNGIVVNSSDWNKKKYRPRGYENRSKTTVFATDEILDNTS